MNLRRRHRLLPIIVTVVTLAACGSEQAISAGGAADATLVEGPPATTGGTTEPALDLAGRSLDSVDVLVDGADPGMIPGVPLSIDLQLDGTVSATGGCNGLFGDYRIEDDRLVTVGHGVTEMACLLDGTEPDGQLTLEEQDLLVQRLLAWRPTITIDGDTVVLSTAEITATFVDRES